MARRVKTEDSHHYYAWLDKADEDMYVAEVLRDDPRCRDICAFHCQQAVEKALKAYLLMGSPYPLDGHNLSWLCKQATKKHKDFAQWMDECIVLSSYYVETRYPSDLAQPLDEQEIQRAFRMASEIYRYICGLVEAELERRKKQSVRDRMAAGTYK